MQGYLVRKIFIFSILISLISFNLIPVSTGFYNNCHDVNKIEIKDNNSPPTAPEISGPSNCKVGIKYNWTFVSTDPEGENITYYIDWGDECGGAEYHGPYPSGEEITVSHIYLDRNTYIINSLAIDSSGGESPWTYFEITIPRFRYLQNPFTCIFNRLLQLFPFLNLLIEN